MSVAVLSLTISIIQAASRNENVAPVSKQRNTPVPSRF